MEPYKSLGETLNCHQKKVKIINLFYSFKIQIKTNNKVTYFICEIKVCLVFIVNDTADGCWGNCVILSLTIHEKINWYKLSKNNIFLWLYSFISRIIFIYSRVFVIILTALFITFIRAKYWKQCKSPEYIGKIK